MNYLKLIGLTAITALALAAAGASTASADVTCKEAPNASGECKTLKENSNSNNWLSGTEFTMTSPSGAPAKLTISGGSISYIRCHLALRWKDTSNGSNTPGTGISGEVIDMEWTQCVTDFGGSCTASTGKGYSTVQTATGDTGNGILKISGAGSKTRFNCLGIFECGYEPTANGLNLSFVGGSPATGEASEQPLTIAEPIFGCGTGAKLDASYEVTAISGTTSKAAWLATKNA